ncbi:hypothetical protein Chor_012612 [Crotalus horridus]
MYSRLERMTPEPLSPRRRGKEEEEEEEAGRGGRRPSACTGALPLQPLSCGEWKTAANGNLCKRFLYAPNGVNHQQKPLYVSPEP